MTFDRLRTTTLILGVMWAFLLVGCSSGGGGGGVGIPSGATVNLSGADGGPNSGSAGDGGDIYVDWYGDVTLSTATGQVDTSFTLPGSQPSYLSGNDELVVSSDMAIAATVNGAVVGTDSYYMVFTNSVLYQALTGSAQIGTDTVVDSISVAAGATLTLGHNYPDRVFLMLSGDVEIAGTLRVDSLTANPLDSGDLVIYARQVFITPTGSVITAGGGAAAGSSVRGGNGGHINLQAYLNNGGFLKNEGILDASGGKGAAGSDGGNGAYIYLWSDGIAINTGSLNSSGGDGDNGGNADYSEIETYTWLFNTGELTAEGGMGTNGVGGAGNWIGLYGYYSGIFNSGDLSVNGGDGTTGGGDATDGIDLYVDYSAPLVSSGTLTADGGNATGASGDGGFAGYVQFETYGGSHSITGTLSAAGGDAGANTIFSGGDGGDLYVYIWDEYDYGYGEGMSPGDVKVDAAIDLTGGDGETGGQGGDADFESSYNYEAFPPTGTLTIYSSAFLLDGGDALGNNGGDGGDFEIYTEDAWSGDDYTTYPVGAIRNQVMISSAGGAGADTNGYIGGTGGYLGWEAEGEYYVGSSVLENSGAIDISGGSGDYGGNSGQIYWFGRDELNNSGTITAMGGVAQSFAAGNSDSIEFYSTVDVINSAEIIANGGDSIDSDGGDGSSYVAMYSGGHTSNSGPIFAEGGVGNMTTGIGGDGGYIDLLSQGTLTTNRATISVMGGGGLYSGSNGDIFLDLANYTPANGIL